MIIIAVLSCFLPVLRCSTPRYAGGSDNPDFRVSGFLVDSLGNPAKNAQVKLVPDDYDPVSHNASSSIPLDTTDASGRYCVAIRQKGDYTILAVDISQRTRGIVQGIAVQDTATIVSTDTLRSPGSIRVIFPQISGSVPVFVFIPGTDISVLCNPSSRYAILDSVPSGTMPSVCSVEPSDPASLDVLAQDVVVLPGASTLAGKTGWNFSRVIFLNTTAGGAGVSGMVLDFPVLIRLTKDNFNFGEAKADGSDIRFAKQDGSPLSYEIEQWDETQSSAAIWVKADTVYGNDSTHFIQMAWGNPNVASASNGEAVFDTADGNVGVWHLGPGIGDATQNTDNGIDSSTVDAIGIIGQCRHFNPAQRSFITIPNESRFNLTTNITLSAWVLVDSFTYQWQTIVAKGDHAFRLHCDTTNKVGVFSLTCADTVSSGYQDAHGKTLINDHQWHLLTGVYDGSVMRMYTDGILEREMVVNMPCTSDTLNLTIGDNRQHSPRFFAGSIDEMRVLHTAMTGDWVKLCYMNQKQSDAFIVFK
jgi:hypothetical protein